MPEVKIILVDDTSYSYIDEPFIKDSITDWEEVSIEDLKNLSEYKRYFPKPPNGYTYVIMVKNFLTVKEAFTSIKDMIEKAKIDMEKEKHKKEEINRKRQETKRKRQEEKERKELERLKEKYAT
jgi:hypothetical protein